MPAQQNIHITIEEYLRTERESDTKSEYLNGDIFSMAGASRAHNQITSNLVVALAGELSDRPCSVYISDMKVKTKTRETNKYSYPDVVVTCGDESFEDDNQWVYSEYHGLEDEVRLATLDCSVSTAEIYRRVRL